MAWLAGYKYRKQITIDGSTVGEQTDYNLKLTVHKAANSDLDDNVYLENHSETWPNDIRFTKSDGTTELDYWVEDADRHFTETGVAAPFYPNIPPAICHNNKTYVVFQGDSLDPYITYFDHVTKSWSAPVKVGTNPLAADDHGVPSLLRDSSGYWHVFYGCHNTLMQHAKSTNIDDISLWTDKGDIGLADMTYPVPILASNGDIYLFYRKKLAIDDYPECYIKSGDDGENWDAEVKIIDFSAVSNRVYVKSVELETGTPEKIHIAWTYSDGPGNWRRNIYHAYLVITGGDAGKLFSMDETDLGVCITKAEADANCLVYDSGTNSVWGPAAHIYGGVPYIIFPEDDGADHPQHFKFTKWNGLSWDSPVIISAVPINARWEAPVDFIVHSATDIEAYFGVQSSGFDRGGDIVRWDYDGSWSETNVLIEAYEQLSFPWIVKDYQEELKVVFTTVAIGDYSTGLKVFAYGDKGFLPSAADPTATIWPEFDSIPVDPGSANFYIYYGKVNASSASNGSNTFPFFDHFLGDGIDAGKWIEWLTVGVGYYSVSHSILYIVGSVGSWEGVGAKIKYSAPKAFRFYAKMDDDADHTIIGIEQRCDGGGGNKDNAEFAYDVAAGNKVFRTYNDSVTTADARAPSLATYRTLDILWTAIAVKFYVDDSLESTIAANIPDESCGANFIIKHLKHIWVDWALAREYADPEPTWGTWGSEEEESLPSAGGGSMAAKLIGAGLL